MDTFFAKNRLSAYLDGALPEAEASEVADAIARDPELKAEYEVKLRQLKAQHEEDLRKVYATIREAYVQSQSGHRD